MAELLESIAGQIRLTAIVDIALTALLIYWLFSLIRGTRAVRLVIGVTVLIAVYFAAQALELLLLTQILQAGAVVGLFALVVVFQPELRRALEQIGRVGSAGWLLSPTEARSADHVAREVARAARLLAEERTGALIVLERETGLEDFAETGEMIHADLSTSLLRTLFTPRTPLHDGAVILRGETILAAGVILPLAETTLHSERFGTRHRAALGVTEQTDAVAIIVSEESGQISLVERARIRRNLDEAQLRRAIVALLHPQAGRRSSLSGWSAGRRTLVPRMPGRDVLRNVPAGRRARTTGGDGPSGDVRVEASPGADDPTPVPAAARARQ